MKNKMSQTIILMMFGKNRLYELSDTEKEGNADWFDYFRQMLLEGFDEVSDCELDHLGLHVKFADHIVPDYGKPLKMDLLTSNLTGLREGKGNLFFFWPEDFYDFLQRQGIELNPVYQKEDSYEEQEQVY